MPHLCFVAGDPSGDAHAARLIEALRSRLSALSVSALGGPAMQRAGATLLEDLTQAAAIGPFDAARHAARFARATRRLEEHLRRHSPDLVILVDFGDFNLPVIAPLVTRYRRPILYYISPQVWAWGCWRMRWIRRYVDRMVVLFPFEEALYRREGIPVTWVGHPLVDQAQPSLSREAAGRRFGLNPWRRTVGLLPGSRAREITRHWPLMLSAAEQIAWRMPGVQFLAPKAPAVAEDTLRAPLSRAAIDVHLADGPMADALQLMDAAVVASGTATLETALGEVPMAVVYRASWPTYLAARMVIRTPHIALVNVVAGRAIVPELVQRRARASTIANEIVDLLRNTERSARMKTGLRGVNAALGPPGAVERAASVVLEMLEKSGSTAVDRRP